MKRQYMVAASTIAIGLLVVAGLSKPGRVTFRKIVSVFAAQAPDVIQRTREKHGWTTQPVQSSLVRGTMTYYNPAGFEERNFKVLLYRKYPDRIRMELEQVEGGVKMISGFDGKVAWRVGAKSVDEFEAREIRAHMRAWPERLFVTLDSGAPHRTVGRHREDRQSATPWSGQQAVLDQEIVVDEIEVEDLLGLSVKNGQGEELGDRRRLSYWVKSDDSMIYATRWLEPYDPKASADDPKVPKIEMRADFGQWKEVDHVKWPYEVIYRRGGRVSYRLQASEVKLNEPMPDTLFKQE